MVAVDDIPVVAGYLPVVAADGWLLFMVRCYAGLNV